MSELIKHCQMQGSWAVLSWINHEHQPWNSTHSGLFKYHSIFNHRRLLFCEVKVQTFAKWLFSVFLFLNQRAACKSLGLVFIKLWILLALFTHAGAGSQDPCSFAGCWPLQAAWSPSAHSPPTCHLRLHEVHVEEFPQGKNKLKLESIAILVIIRKSFCQEQVWPKYISYSSTTASAVCG